MSNFSRLKTSSPLICLCVAISALTLLCSARADEQSSEEEESAIFVPTPTDVVEKMLELGNVTQDDLLYDLGCGDGRIVVAAAKKCGCKAVGYDISERKVRQSIENVKRHGLEKLVRIEQ